MASLQSVCCGICRATSRGTPANEAVSYAHAQHISVLSYDPRATASDAYLKVAVRLVKDMYTEVS